MTLADVPGVVEDWQLAVGLSRWLEVEMSDLRTNRGAAVTACAQYLNLAGRSYSKMLLSQVLNKKSSRTSNQQISNKPPQTLLHPANISTLSMRTQQSIMTHYSFTVKKAITREADWMCFHFSHIRQYLSFTSCLTTITSVLGFMKEFLLTHSDTKYSLTLVLWYL